MREIFQVGVNSVYWNVLVFIFCFLILCSTIYGKILEKYDLKRLYGKFIKNELFYEFQLLNSDA